MKAHRQVWRTKWSRSHTEIQLSSYLVGATPCSASCAQSFSSKVWAAASILPHLTEEKTPQCTPSPQPSCVSYRNFPLSRLKQESWEPGVLDRSRGVWILGWSCQRNLFCSFPKSVKQLRTLDLASLHLLQVLCPWSYSGKWIVLLEIWARVRSGEDQGTESCSLGPVNPQWQWKKLFKREIKCWVDSWDGGSQHKDWAQVWSNATALLLSSGAYKGTTSGSPAVPVRWVGWWQPSGDSRTAVKGFLWRPLLKQKQIFPLCEP